MEYFASLAFTLLAYVWGSLSPSYVIVRAVKGIDLRHYGSGTVSGTMVGIELGQGWKWTVIILDVLKGLIPPWMAALLGLPLSTVVLVGLAVIVGHNWSLFLHFAGGRGFAATVGLMTVWDPKLALGVIALLLAGPFTPIPGLTPVVGFLLLAPAAWLLGDPLDISLGCLALAIIIMLKRLEANRIPLPTDHRAKITVIWRRIILDRDVPPGQPWEERQKFD